MARRFWDRSAADAANKLLGDAGEQYVLEVERRRLTEDGRADLADLVVWTARDDGDGAGFDIASFTSNLICGWGWPFRPATPTSRPNPTRNAHPISTTSADANRG